MPRTPRVVLEGLPHHITQRGNNGQRTYMDEDDYSCFLAYLNKLLPLDGVRLLAYCLMPNHFHLVAEPSTKESLGRLLNHLTSAYAMRFNRRHGRRGHLWQDRYYSCPMDEAHLWVAKRYVESNPERAGLTATRDAWPWASKCTSIEDALDQSIGPVEFAAVRLATHRGCHLQEVTGNSHLPTF